MFNRLSDLCLLFFEDRLAILDNARGQVAVTGQSVCPAALKPIVPGVRRKGCSDAPPKCLQIIGMCRRTGRPGQS